MAGPAADGSVRRGISPSIGRPTCGRHRPVDQGSSGCFGGSDAVRYASGRRSSWPRRPWLTFVTRAGTPSCIPPSRTDYEMGASWPACGPCPSPSMRIGGWTVNCGRRRRREGADALGEYPGNPAGGLETWRVAAWAGSGHPRLQRRVLRPIHLGRPPGPSWVTAGARRPRRGDCRPLAVEALQPGRPACRLVRRGPELVSYLKEVRKHVGFMVPDRSKSGVVRWGIRRMSSPA